MNKGKINVDSNSDIFILNNKESDLNIQLSDNENKNLYFIDILESNVDFNLEVILTNKNIVNFVYCSLNSESYKKNVKVTINHNGNDSFSSCEVFSINKNSSYTNIDLNARIEPKSLNNNCIQIIRGILLSNDSRIKGKPNLFIDSNNIKAKHSLAIGALNKNHLFYLMSKGITRDDSKKLIIIGFFNKLLSKISDEKYREDLYHKIYNRIGEI
ncbi:MAG: SufD family Fe-S cluster assembly protein [Malacoplasma sp.]